MVWVYGRIRKCSEPYMEISFGSFWQAEISWGNVGETSADAAAGAVRMTTVQDPGFGEAENHEVNKSQPCALLVCNTCRSKIHTP